MTIAAAQAITRGGGAVIVAEPTVHIGGLIPGLRQQGGVLHKNHARKPPSTPAI